MSMLSNQVVNELIQIYQMESDRADELALKNHLLNQIKSFEHYELASQYRKEGKPVPPMDKLPTLNEHGFHTKQLMISLNKKFQWILLIHHKHNTFISDETREYLDKKICSLHKKIVKQIQKKNMYIQKIRAKYPKNNLSDYQPLTK